MNIDPATMHQAAEAGGLRRKYDRNPEPQFRVQEEMGGPVVEGPQAPPQNANPNIPPMSFQPNSQMTQVPQPENPPATYAPIFEDDEPIFPGGPYESQILSWKKQFGEVFLIDINGESFIFRTMNRFEYKQIVSQPNTDPLMREEIICEVCTLFPSNYIFEVMSSGKAGVPAVLSQHILEKSSFTRDVSVRTL